MYVINFAKPYTTVFALYMQNSKDILDVQVPLLINVTSVFFAVFKRLEDYSGQL